MKNSKLYVLVRPIISFLFKLFYRPTIVGKENIPSDGGVVLAGNHTNNFDCLLLLSSTKRPIHFLAKIELFRGIKKIIFANLGLMNLEILQGLHVFYLVLIFLDQQLHLG